MTAREAIEALTSGYLDTSDTEPYMKTIIKALEKQVPTKPIKSDREVRYCEVWKCPDCGFEWSSRVVDYCYKCGQAIDWEDI